MLPVKITYVAETGNVTTEEMKRDLTDRAVELWLPRRIHTNHDATVIRVGWAGVEEVEEERFLSSPQVTQEVSGRAINQLSQTIPTIPNS